ncbi:AN1-type zinc finger protein 6 isoform X1 [Centroberyx gerrardi]|uniref:AN1-type zinc finger protein 6 isoform X1 n=1 Tax=Centroberyx gerrardi TaxID=166262 RepID=UPI003AABE80B
MAQETNQSQAPLLCTTGCGFYGSPRNNGMCSVCYKDFLQRQNNNGRVSPPGLSSTDSSIGESLLAQCSDTTTVSVPTAISHTDTASGHTRTWEPTSFQEAAPCQMRGDCIPTFGATTASATSSTDERTSGGKASLKADDLQTSVSEDSVQASVETEEKPKAKKNRCFTCRKKVGLTGFDCRCGNVFCSMHRYSDIHSCTFDYKADAAEKIRKENPVIVGEKIQKI